MDFLTRYGVQRRHFDGVGRLFAEDGSPLSDEGTFEFAQFGDGQLILGIRLAAPPPIDWKRRAVRFTGTCFNGDLPKVLTCKGSVVGSAWGSHAGYQRTDLVISCAAAKLSPRGEFPEAFRAAKVALVNYFGHATLIQTPVAQAELTPVADIQGLRTVYSTGGGIFLTHQVRLKGDFAADGMHGFPLFLELALSLEMGTRVDHFDVEAEDADAESYTWLWSPSPIPRAAHPTDVYADVDPEILLNVLVRRRADADTYPPLDLLSHYLQACNFALTATGRGLAAASLIDVLRQCFETRDGRPEFPVSPAQRRRIRAVAKRAGAAEITSQLSEADDRKVAKENLDQALSAFGRSTFRSWLRAAFESHEILEVRDERQWLADVIVEARNKLVHEGRYAGSDGGALDDEHQWAALLFVAAGLLCRWFGYDEGFRGLPRGLKP